MLPGSIARRSTETGAHICGGPKKRSFAIAFSYALHEFCTWTWLKYPRLPPEVAACATAATSAANMLQRNQLIFTRTRPLKEGKAWSLVKVQTTKQVQAFAMLAVAVLRALLF